MTRYDTVSNFPDSIDSLIFMSDVNIEQLPLVVYHRNLLRDGHYTDAGEYIESQNVDSFCASLFNMLESRIYSTQTYLKNKKSKWYDEHNVNSPFYYGEDEPDDKESTPIWII